MGSEALGASPLEQPTKKGDSAMSAILAVNEVKTATNNGSGADSKKGKASLRSKKANVGKMMQIEAVESFSALTAIGMAKTNDNAVVASLQSFWNDRLEACGGNEKAAAVSGHSLLSNRSYRRFLPDVANAAKKHSAAVDHGVTSEGGMTLYSLLTRTVKALYRTVKENAETGTKASPVLPVEWLTEPHRSLVFGALTASGISPAVKPSDAGLASLCNSKAVQVTLLIECVASKAKAIRADWDAFTVPSAPVVVSVPVSPVPVKASRSKAKDKAAKVPEPVKASSAE